jgi:hypothetical protein
VRVSVPKPEEKESRVAEDFSVSSSREVNISAKGIASGAGLKVEMQVVVILDNLGGVWNS